MQKYFTSTIQNQSRIVLILIQINKKKLNLTIILPKPIPRFSVETTYYTSSSTIVQCGIIIHFFLSNINIGQQFTYTKIIFTGHNSELSKLFICDIFPSQCYLVSSVHFRKSSPFLLVIYIYNTDSLIPIEKSLLKHFTICFPPPFHIFQPLLSP